MMEVQSIDFKQANAVLNKIRVGLEEEEAAWGPDSEQNDDGHLSGEAGDGGATNVSDVEDVLDAYFTGVADALMAKYELSDDEAYDFILYAADTAEAMGLLPVFPDDDAEDAEIAEWYGKAGSVKFDAMVMNLAAKEL